MNHAPHFPSAAGGRIRPIGALALVLTLGAPRPAPARELADPPDLAPERPDSWAPDDDRPSVRLAPAAAWRRTRRHLLYAPLSVSAADGVEALFEQPDFEGARTREALEAGAELQTAGRFQDEHLTLQGGRRVALTGPEAAGRLRLAWAPLDFLETRIDLLTLSRVQGVRDDTPPRPGAEAVRRRRAAVGALDRARCSLKWHFLTWDRRGSGLAWLASGALPMGNPEHFLSTGTADGSAALLFTVDTGPLVFHGRAGLSLTSDPTWFDRKYRTDRLRTFALGAVVPLSIAGRPCAAIAQWQGHNRPLPDLVADDRAPQSMQAGLRFAWGPHFVALGATRALNEAAAPYGVFLQVDLKLF